MSNLTIVNVGYRSTNFWVINAGTSRLLVDLGWPGGWGELAANLRRMDIPLDEIRYGLATHYHIDHAGAAQDLKNAGVPLLVVDDQVDTIPLMKQHIKPQDNYTDISTHGNVVISCAESRTLLEGIGIPGEILPTPGHSGDSVSLLLDNGAVFTGDLAHPAFVGMEDPAVVAASWRLLQERGATRIYPGRVFPQPMKILETERLILRHMVPADLDDLWALYCNPEITRFIPDAPRTYEEAKEELEWHQHGHPRHPELGLWATIHKESGQFIGRCGLLPWTFDGVDEVEVAYTIAQAYWGQGLATEAARAIRDHAFEKSGLTRLVCLIDEGNKASARVAEKIGMAFEKEAEIEIGPFHLYTMTRKLALDHKCKLKGFHMLY